MTNTPPDWNPSFDLQNQNQIDVHDEMRRQCPVAFSEAFGWSVFRHDDVTRVLHDHDSFSSAVSQHLSVPNGMDPPEHTAYRRMVDRYFASERIDAFEPTCRKIAKNLIHGVISSGCDVEVMSALATQFAAQAQCAFLGWPSELCIPLIEWVATSHQAIRDSDRERMSQLAREFEAIVDRQVDLRLSEHAFGGDVTTLLMQERIYGRRLSSEELSSILRNWTVGEIGTISASIGILVHYLTQSNPLQQSARTDPSRLPAMIDEILRVCNPLVANRRLTTCPVQVGDRRIEAGQRITIHWIAANRDEQAIPHADEVRPERDPSPNLLYGTGIHVCPGAPLARMELRVFIESLLGQTSWVAAPTGSSSTYATFPASGFSSLLVNLNSNPPDSISIPQET